MPPKARTAKKALVAPSSDGELDLSVEQATPPPPTPRARKKAVQVLPAQPQPAKMEPRRVKKILQPKSPEPEYMSVSESEDDEVPDEGVCSDGEEVELEEEVEFINEEAESIDEEAESVDEEAVDDDGHLSELEEDVELAPDDMMYPEPPVPARVRLAKRPAPMTPPLETRSTAQEIPTPRTPSASPLSGPSAKKARVAPPPAVVPAPSTPARKVVPKARAAKTPVEPKSPRVPREKAKAIPDRNLAPPKAAHSRSSRKAAPVPDPLPEPEEWTPEPEVETDPQQVDLASDMKLITFLNESNGEVPHLEDLVVHRVKHLPAESDFMSISNQDPTLRDLGHYADLPALTKATVTAVRDSPSVGLVFFNVWKEFLGEDKFQQELAISIMAFKKDGRFVNLARVDPRRLTSHKLWGGSREEIRDLHNMPVIALTPVMVIDSYVREMNTSLPYSGNYLTGILHSEEWARWTSVVGMVSGHKTLQMQIWGDAITFGTKGQASASYNASTTGSTGYKNLPDVPGMFNLTASPSKASGGTAMKLGDIAPLEYGHTIPVYDARNKTFPYSPDVFNNLDDHLKRFVGEIPRGSFAVVGHLTQVQKMGEHHRVVVYPRWVILIGTR